MKQIYNCAIMLALSCNKTFEIPAKNKLFQENTQDITRAQYVQHRLGKKGTALCIGNACVL